MLSPRLRNRFSVASSPSIRANYNLTRLGGIFALNNDRVAIQNTSFNHGVALNFQSVIIAASHEMMRHFNKTAWVRNRINRGARRDFTKKRNALFWSCRTCVSTPTQVQPQNVKGLPSGYFITSIARARFGSLRI